MIHPLLDASDKDFVKDLTKALGVKEGDKITFISPQFKRTNGRIITYLPNTPEEYEAIKKMDPDNLKKVGCSVWKKTEKGTHWLYPEEWYESIPNGTEIICISGNKEKFEKGKTDNDIRFGCLAYGFIQITH